MKLRRRTLLAAGAATLAAPAHIVRAQTASETIRIGLLHDMSGTYRDIAGPTSVVCAKQAIAEFTAANPSIKVELYTADHLNKADTGLSITRKWFDTDGVDVVQGVSNSALAIALKTVTEQKDKVHLNTSAATSALTGEYCSLNTIHWSYDTYCLANSTGGPLVQQGADTWYFITPNYAFGAMFQADVTASVVAAGGKVIGSVTYPFPETVDFSTYLLQAQASGAKAIAFTGAGTDFVNVVKQVQEFGIGRDGKQRFVGFTGYINSVMALGLAAAQGLTESETFYWDLNDRTRAFMARVKPNLPSGVYPCHNHAGDYAALMHYLKVVKEVGPAKAKASGRDMVAAMKAMPTDDDCFGKGVIREDGRKLHPSYLFAVKSPAESKYEGDVYKVLAEIPPEKAFRSLKDGKCPLVKA